MKERDVSLFYSFFEFFLGIVGVLYRLRELFYRTWRLLGELFYLNINPSFIVI